LIHSSLNGIYISNSTHTIVDVDVAAYYVSLPISYSDFICPPQFKNAYGKVFSILKNKRAKYPKKTPLNEAFKLAGNSSFGKGNSIYSKLFHRQTTLKTTLTGQLLLTKLVEDLSKLASLSFIQHNTDGITYYVSNEQLNESREIYKNWEKYAKLELEENIYSKMICRDVNNYISQSTNGKVKLKGAFEIDRGLVKDHSMLIVPKAAKAYFIDGIKPEEFILFHEDIFDFFLAVNVKTKEHQLWQGELVTEQIPSKIKNRFKTIVRFEKEKRLQKVTRYLVTKQGKTFMKIMPPLAGKDSIRESNVHVDYLCTECNNLTDVNLASLFKLINYDFYIKETYKLINSINK